MKVSDGDLVHADRHGAVAIPKDLIESLETAIKELVVTEHLILKAVRKSNFDF